MVDMALIVVRALAALARDRRRTRPRRRRSRTGSASTPRGSSLWVSFWGAGVVVVGHLRARASRSLYLVSRSLLVVRVRARQRHLARHHRLEPDLVGVRRRDRASWRRSACSDPVVGLMAGAVLLVATSVGVRHAAGPLDRLAPGHQPRRCSSATRWSASSWARCSRSVFAQLFMAAYPVLLLDQTAMTADQQPAAMERRP